MTLEYPKIAVIGIALRFPGSNNTSQYWKNLTSGSCLIQRMDELRWQRIERFIEARFRERCRWGAFLDELDAFDESFFGISPREASFMDPQQRIMLELAWSCLEDACYRPSDLIGSDTGVFIGCGTSDYRELQERSHTPSTGHTSLGSSVASMIPNRISYQFGFHGPSIPVDAWCASSLYALHAACQSLHSGECAMALTGGVNLLTGATIYNSFSDLGMLSESGQCRAFDALADGYVRGEGAGLILLKPLECAIRDNDHIYGAICSSAVNHGGRARQLTSPNPYAQASVIRQAIRRAGFDSTSVTYVETHGTGTPLGDPIETNALKRAFQSPGLTNSIEAHYCVLGAVKPLIGHLEFAAGIASIIKVLLSFQHRMQLAVPRLNQLNPRVELSNSPFCILQENRSWAQLTASDGSPIPRRAGISSFGLGGANAHVILEEYPLDRLAIATAESPKERYHLFKLSAQAPHSLLALGKQYSEHLGNCETQVVQAKPSDLAQSLSWGREHFAHRAAIVARSIEEFRERCLRLGHGASDRFIRTGIALPNATVAWFIPDLKTDSLCSLPKIRDLFLKQSFFRNCMQQCEQRLRDHCQIQLWPVELDPQSFGHVDASVSTGRPWKVSQRWLAAMQFSAYASLGSLWKESGLTPKIIVASESNRVVVDFLIGKLTLEQAITAALQDLSDQEAVSPSPMMDHAQSEFAMAIQWNEQREANRSTARCTTDCIPLSKSVAQVLVDANCQIVLDLGIPSKECAQHLLNFAGNTPPLAVSTLSPSLANDSESDYLSALATFYSFGWNLHAADSTTSNFKKTPFPTYRFQRTKHWFEIEEQALRFDSDEDKSDKTGVDRLWLLAESTWIRQHKLFGHVVLPGAVSIHAMLNGRAQPTRTTSRLTQVALTHPIVLASTEAAVELRLQLQDIHSSSPYISCLHRPQGGDRWICHAEGQWTNSDVAKPCGTESLDGWFSGTTHAGASFYDSCSQVGLSYGEVFRRIDQVWKSTNCVTVTLASSGNGSVDQEAEWILSLDACFQAGLVLVDQLGFMEKAFVPCALESLQLWQSIANTKHCIVRHCELSHLETQSKVLVDVSMVDQNLQAVGEIKGLEFRPLTENAIHSLPPSEIQDWFYELHWQRRYIAQPSSATSLANINRQQRVSSAETRKELQSQSHFDLNTFWLSDYAGFLEGSQKLAQAYLEGALASLGWQPELGQTLDTQQVASELGIQAHKRQALRQLFKSFVASGHLVQEENMLCIAQHVRPRSADELSSIKSRLLSRFPWAKYELALMANCGEVLGQVLIGELNPLDLLFSQSGICAADFYRRSAVANYFNLLVCDALRELIRSKNGKPLRIIEIGAGTGGTTSAVLPILPRDGTQYVFTDKSPVFFDAAECEFSDYPFVEYRVLDIEKTTSAQGWIPEQFDIVIASNVLHATRDIQQTLRNVRELLTKEGTLLLVELLRPQAWLDFTFGLLEGWWRFDDRIRLDYPLIPKETWTILLEEAGFSQVESLPASTSFHQALMVAKVAERKASTPATKRNWFVFGERNADLQSLVHALNSRGDSVTLFAIDRAENEAQFDAQSRAHALELLLAQKTLSGAIYLNSGVKEGWDVQDCSDRAATELKPIYGNVLDFIQSLIRSGHKLPSGAWFVTHGAYCITPDDPLMPHQIIVGGLLQTLALEHPELACRCVDLDPSIDLSHQWNTLIDELDARQVETQIAIRANERLVARLKRQNDNENGFAPSSGAHSPLTIRADGVYWITGGTGGLGLVVADWLAAQGARYLILTSRHPPAQDSYQRISQLRMRGIDLQVIVGDITCKEDLSRILKEIDESRIPLVGVYQCAGVLRDGTITNLSRQDFHDVLATKILGSWNLHRLTLDRSVEQFVLFSSTAAVLGSAGQANHASANTFLDQLARYRRMQGLPGISINWGPWAEVGAAAERDMKMARRMDDTGIGWIYPEAGKQALAHVLAANRAQMVVVPIDWQKFLSPYSNLPAYFSHVASNKAIIQPARVLASEVTALFDTRQSRPVLLRSLIEYLTAQVQRLLRLSRKPEIQTGFSDLGFDSLMSVELRNRINTDLQFGVPLSSTAVFDFPNIQALAQQLLERLADAPQPGQASNERKLFSTILQEPIAIVGMSCRVPGALNPQQLWHQLVQGFDASSEFPTQRSSLDVRYDPERAKPGFVYTRRGSFLDDIDQFDPEFFSFSPQEAQYIDPQQRLLLEQTWYSLENAGIASHDLRGTKTGVFLGVSESDYRQLAFESSTESTAFAGLGTGTAFAAGRLSFVFGFQGPSIVVDTACSSSLVSIHQACQSLRMGECDTAIAGGVHLMITSRMFYFLSQVNSLSVDGRCRAFDDSADGFGRGEGCGILVLKRIHDAQRDGDKIWAVLRGSAVNQDGASSGMTVPNRLAQEHVIQQALEQSGLAANEIDYLEAHGTGTRLGDPIEIQAAAQVYGRNRATDSPLLIGSIKSNIGHLEAAAGVCGVIKAVLALHHRLIPPHLHFQTPNRYIPWANLPVSVVKNLQPWPMHGRLPVAAVSSFGMSGTNAHAILQAADSDTDSTNTSGTDRKNESAYIFTLSARSASALVQLAKDTASWISSISDEELPDACFTACCGRNSWQYRRAFVIHSASDAAQQLQQFGQTGQELKPVVSQHAAAPAVHWLMCHNVTTCQQLRTMATELSGSEPELTLTLRQVEQVASSAFGFKAVPFVDALLATHVTFPATVDANLMNFSVLLAIGRLWLKWCGQPDAIHANGIGMLVAATLAELISLEMAVEILSVCWPVAGSRPNNELSPPFASATDDSIDGAYIGSTFPVVRCARSGQRLTNTTCQNFSFWKSEFVREQFGQNATSVNRPAASAGSEIVVNLSLEALFQSAKPFVGDWPEDSLQRGPEVASIGRKHAKKHNSIVYRFLSGLATLYESGVQVRFSSMHVYWNRRKLLLPNYPFQRTSHWVDHKADSVFSDSQRCSATASPASVFADIVPNDLGSYLISAGVVDPSEREAFDKIMTAWKQLKREQIDANTAQSFALERRWIPSQTVDALCGTKKRGVWFILSDAEQNNATDIETALCARLKVGGHTVIWLANTDDFSAGDNLSQSSNAPLSQEINGIVFTQSLTLPRDCESHEHLSKLQNCILNLIELIKLLRSGNTIAPVFILTSGAYAASPEETISPNHRSMCGFAMTMAVEQPALFGGVIDVAHNFQLHKKANTEHQSFYTPNALIDAIYTQLHTNSQEDIRLLRREGCYVARLSPLEVYSSSAWQCEADGTYVVTGGTGALGLSTVRMLAQSGAKHIAILSRRAASDDVEQALSEIEQQYLCMTNCYQCDIANAAELHSCLSRFGSELPSVRGVIHAAGVESYWLIEDLDAARVAEVLNAKVLGTINLHRFFQSNDLAFFVCYSSIAAAWGSQGQAHYAAANAFMDAVCDQRRQLGLAGQSIQFGPWAGKGMADSETHLQLEETGIRRLLVSTASQGIELAISQNRSLVFADIDWRRFLPTYQARRLRPLFAELNRLHIQNVPVAKQNESPWHQKLQAVAPKQRKQLIDEKVIVLVNSVLGINLSDADHTVGFFDLGLDSIRIVELRNRLHEAFSISTLPMTLAIEYPNVKKLSEFVYNQLFVVNAEDSVATEISSKVPLQNQAHYLEQVASMTEEEAMLQLVEALRDRKPK